MTRVLGPSRTANQAGTDRGDSPTQSQAKEVAP